METQTSSAPVVEQPAIQQTILDQMNWRYAVKKFDQTKKLTEDQIHFLLESTDLSATSFGLQPYRVLLIENSEVRAKLSPAAYHQSQITEASHLVLFAASTNLDDAYVDRFVDLIAKTRNIPHESLHEYTGAMKHHVSSKDLAARISWSARQAYIGLGTLLETAALLHIDACPMEGFNAEEFDTILDLRSKNLTTLAVVALGYRSENDSFQHYKKVRLPLEEFVHRL